MAPTQTPTPVTPSITHSTEGREKGDYEKSAKNGAMPMNGVENGGAKTSVLDDAVLQGSSNTRSFPRMAVAADTEIASAIVKQVLLDGGSAVDAGIAGMFATGVINPQHSGMGGSMFMMCYATAKGETERKMFAVDGRTTTPRAGTKEFYGSDYFRKRRGPFSIGIPGEVRGFYEAWQKFGKLSWARLIEPAINLCREGYKLRPTTSQRFVTHWEDMLSWSNMNHDDLAWKELFQKRDGTMFKQGELLTNLRLGETLERVAQDPSSYYSGDLAEDVLADLVDHGSHITKEDLKEFKAIWREPFVTEFKSVGLTSHIMPAPSSGPVLHFILKLFERFGHTPKDLETEEGAALAYHHFIECVKFGFAEKSRIGDPAFAPEVQELMETICSEKYITSIESMIDDDRTHETMYYNPTVGKSKDGGTTHLSVVAENGDAVAITGTLNGIFGSYIRGKRTGIIFNNENATFSIPDCPDSEGYLEPSAVNHFAAGKRPKSSKSPLIMLDEEGQVRLVVGGSGGRRITTATSFVLANNLWLGQDIKRAVDLPRLAHFLSPNDFEYEEGFPARILRDLSTIGHEHHQCIGVPKNPEEYREQLKNNQKPCISIVQAISNTCPGNHFGPTPCTKSCLVAVSDFRKGGTPDGY